MVGIGTAELAFVWALFFGGFGVPVGMVPGEEDPYLCQIAPDDCHLYASWSGTMPADPNGNATEKWIAQKGIQEFWKNMEAELDRVVADTGEAEPEPGSGLDEGKDDFAKEGLHEFRPIVLKMQKVMCTQPCAMFIDRVTKKGVAGNFVFKLGEMEEDISADLKRIDDDVLAKRKWTRDSVNSMDVIVMKNLVGYQANLDLRVGIHNGYLLAAFAIDGEKASFDSVFDSEKSPEPAWLTEIKNELPVQRRSSISMVDVKFWVSAFEQEEGPLEYNPIKNVKKIGFVTGLDSESSVARAWIQSDGELGGFFKMFKGDPLGEEELRNIPSNQTFATVSRLSSEDIYNTIERFAKAYGSEEEFDEMIAGIDGFAGVTLKEDLLEKLDDYAFLYGNITSDDLSKIIMKGDFGSPRVLVGIGIKDEMAFLDTMEAFSSRIEEVVEQNPSMKFEVERINDVTVYRVKNNDRGWGVNEICFAQANSQLLISSKFDKLEAHIINGFTDGPGKQNRLIDQAGVKDVFKFGKSIGCEGPIAIVQLDTTPFFKHVWPIANVFVPRQNEFKIPQLPNADTMLNGITPRISASFKTENGYQLYQKSVIPNSTIPSTVGAFMGMFLAIIDVVE